LSYFVLVGERQGVCGCHQRLEVGDTGRRRDMKSFIMLEIDDGRLQDASKDHISDACYSFERKVLNCSAPQVR
jgi:hypothetical protein